MAVPYYDQTKVKLDLRITDTGTDTQLAHWNDEAEAEIDDLLNDKATKARRITSLPILPFAAASVPESVQGAADAYVKARYYEFTKNFDMAKSWNDVMDKKLSRYIERLAISTVIYWRIAR